MENYKKHIIKEEERNENLTMVLNKANADIAHVKKQIDTSVAKRDQLKADYMTYTRTLQETEQSLAKANTVSIDYITYSNFSNSSIDLLLQTSSVVCDFAMIIGLYSQTKRAKHNSDTN